MDIEEKDSLTIGDNASMVMITEEGDGEAIQVAQSEEDKLLTNQMESLVISPVDNALSDNMEEETPPSSPPLFAQLFVDSKTFTHWQKYVETPKTFVPSLHLKVDKFFDTVDMIIRIGLEHNLLPRRSFITLAELAKDVSRRKSSLQQEKAKILDIVNALPEDDMELRNTTSERLFGELAANKSAYEWAGERLSKMLVRLKESTQYFYNKASEITGIDTTAWIEVGSGPLSDFNQAVFYISKFVNEAILPLEAELNQCSAGKHLFEVYPCYFEVPKMLQLFFLEIPPTRMSSNNLIEAYLAAGCFFQRTPAVFINTLYTAFCYASVWKPNYNPQKFNKPLLNRRRYPDVNHKMGATGGVSFSDNVLPEDIMNFHLLLKYVIFDADENRYTFELNTTTERSLDVVYSDENNIDLSHEGFNQRYKYLVQLALVSELRNLQTKFRKDVIKMFFGDSSFKKNIKEEFFKVLKANAPDIITPTPFTFAEGEVLMGTEEDFSPLTAVLFLEHGHDFAITQFPDLLRAHIQAKQTVVVTVTSEEDDTLRSNERMNMKEEEEEEEEKGVTKEDNPSSPKPHFFNLEALLIKYAKDTVEAMEKWLLCLSVDSDEHVRNVTLATALNYRTVFDERSRLIQEAHSWHGEEFPFTMDIEKELNEPAAAVWYLPLSVYYDMTLTQIQQNITTSSTEKKESARSINAHNKKMRANQVEVDQNRPKPEEINVDEVDATEKALLLNFTSTVDLPEQKEEEVRKDEEAESLIARFLQGSTLDEVSPFEDFTSCLERYLTDLGLVEGNIDSFLKDSLQYAVVHLILGLRKKSEEGTKIKPKIRKREQWLLKKDLKTFTQEDYDFVLKRYSKEFMGFYHCFYFNVIAYLFLNLSKYQELIAPVDKDEGKERKGNVELLDNNHIAGSESVEKNKDKEQQEDLHVTKEEVFQLYKLYERSNIYTEGELASALHNAKQQQQQSSGGKGDPDVVTPALLMNKVNAVTERLTQESMTKGYVHLRVGDYLAFIRGVYNAIKYAMARSHQERLDGEISAIQENNKVKIKTTILLDFFKIRNERKDWLEANSWILACKDYLKSKRLECEQTTAPVTTTTVVTEMESEKPSCENPSSSIPGVVTGVEMDDLLAISVFEAFLEDYFIHCTCSETQ